MSVERLHPDDLEALAGRLNTPPALLDAEQAAELLRVPKTWVLAEARADRIPHVRLGRYVRFVGSELEAWWLSRASGPWRSRGSNGRAR
jgi:excisionase family DNA binding protein